MELNLTENQELVNIDVNTETELINIDVTDIVEEIVINTVTENNDTIVNLTEENITINAFPEIEEVTVNTISEIEDIVININTDVSGEGTMFHNELVNLDYDSSGHTGFASKTDINNLQDQVNNKEDKSNKGIADGYVPLNSDAKIDLNYFPKELSGSIVLTQYTASTTWVFDNPFKRPCSVEIIDNLGNHFEADVIDDETFSTFTIHLSSAMSGKVVIA